MQFLDDFVGRVLPCNADFHAFFGILTYLLAVVQNLGFDITLVLNDILFMFWNFIRKSSIINYKITLPPFIH